MMKRFAALAAVAGFLAFAGPVSAQYVGIGAGIPTGDYGDFADTGWLATGGWLFNLGGGSISVGPEVYYGSNGHSDSDDKTNLFGVNGLVELSFGDGDSISPFLFGLIGWMNHQYSPGTGDGSTESGIGFGGGGGFGLPAGLYLEGRIMSASIEDATTALFAISVGWYFGG